MARLNICIHKDVMSMGKFCLNLFWVFSQTHRVKTWKPSNYWLDVLSKFYYSFSKLFKLVITFPRSGRRAKHLHTYMTANCLGCSGTSQEPPRLKSAMTWKLLEHQHCPHWSQFYIAMDCEDVDQERSSCYKTDTLKLYWNVWLPTRTSQMSPGEKFDCQIRQRMFGHNDKR